MGKLTAESIQGASKRGLYPDGDGLYLQVTGAGSKSWIYRYTLRGKARWLGLGTVRDVSLSKARQKRDKARVQVRDGADLVAERKQERVQQKLQSARSMTFRQAATAFIESRKKDWGNSKHAAQWTSTLETYVYPIMGETPLQDIDTPLVLEVLTPIWGEKAETASRVRGRIEQIIAWATFRNYRQGENPARWDGHLEHAELPDRPEVQHFAALPYPKLPALMVLLAEKDGSAARALEFTILTAMRTSAVIGARWTEIDFKDAMWTVPKERMKGKKTKRKAHTVPLSKQALALLHRLPRENEFVFPGGSAGEPLSNMAMAAALQRLGDYRDEEGRRVTVHGMRTTFRNWAAEKRPDVPAVVAEFSLAHTIGDETVEAYFRTQLPELRRELMQSWANFACPPRADNVVPMSGAA
jgi:integrase